MRARPFLLLAGCLGLVLGHDARADDFLYTTNNGAITITGYTGTNPVVTIPDTINDLPVKAIGNNAFYRCSFLTAVKIPAQITAVGYAAFHSCTSLGAVLTDPPTNS